MATSNRNLERVRDALARRGMTVEARKFPSSTRTAADAARAVGCDVSQIAKSLVFRSRKSGEPVLIVTSGANRVDLEKVNRFLGEPLEMADPTFVREKTGFAIGGVPPVGHEVPMRVYLDRTLLACESIWAAAGTSDTVFPLTPEQLLALTDGQPIDVS